MKRLVFLLLTMCSFTLSQAQWWADPYLTEEEKRVDDKTKDEAYLAPTSKLVGKKWYLRDGYYYIFNANGTGEQVEIKYDTYDGKKYYITENQPITWKRNKSVLNITFLSKQLTIKPVTSSISKFSLRVQDEIKRHWARQQNEKRNKYMNSSYECEIDKLTNNIMYLTWISVDNTGKREYDRRGYLSKKRFDEINVKESVKE